MQSEKNYEYLENTAKKHNLNIKVFGIPSLAKFTFSHNHNELKTFMSQEFLKHGILRQIIFTRAFLIMKE